MRERESINEGDIVDAFNRRVIKSGLSPTLTTRPEGFKTAVLAVVKDERFSLMVLDNEVTDKVEVDGYRIRKLVPCECAKLMGLTKDDDEKMKNIGISNSQRYKIYGNGIVTNCIQLIFEHLFKAQYDESYETYDENFTRAAMI